MSSIPFAGFVGPSYVAATPYLDLQRSINLYYESAPEAGAASSGAMLPTPGILGLLGGTGGPVRGLYSPPSKPNLLYFVAGNLLRVAQMIMGTTLGPRTAPAQIVAGTIGTLSTSTGPVSFTDNGTQMALVDGPNGYFINLSSQAFVKIVDAAFYGSTRVDFIDGYFIFNKPGTQQFYVSGLYATTFDPLDFASKEGWPDNIVCCFANNRELWLMGERSTEVWDSQPDLLADGTVAFPFTRNQGAFIQHGIKAPHSLAKLGQTFAWLGTDERGQVAVWVAAGYAPQKISTAAIDAAINKYVKTDDAIGFVYRWNGHEFYQLTFPAADATWVYDVTESQWHERLRLDAKGFLHRHQGSCHAFFAGGSVIGDYRTDILWEQAIQVYECINTIAPAYAEAIPRIRRAPHITQNRNRVRFDSLEIRFQPGVEGDLLYLDKPATYVADPQAMLRWSDDGGATWSNEHWVSIGGRGQYNTRALWRNLGISRDRVFEVRVTDAVNVAIVTAQMAFGACRN